jgi:hypothetical protein
MTLSSLAARAQVVRKRAGAATPIPSIVRRFIVIVILTSSLSIVGREAPLTAFNHHYKRII